MQMVKVPPDKRRIAIIDRLDLLTKQQAAILEKLEALEAQGDRWMLQFDVLIAAVSGVETAAEDLVSKYKAKGDGVGDPADQAKIVEIADQLNAVAKRLKADEGAAAEPTIEPAPAVEPAV